MIEHHIYAIIGKKLMNKFPFLRQFVKFALVGIMNTIIDFGTYILLTRFFPWFAENYLVANGISFLLAITNSFYINKYWTFNSCQKENTTLQYIKFISLCSISLIIVETILFCLIDFFSFYDLLAKLVSMFFGTFFNFYFSRIFVFKAKKCKFRKSKIETEILN